MDGCILLFCIIVGVIGFIVTLFVEWFNELIMFNPSVAWFIIISTIALAGGICVYYRRKANRIIEENEKINIAFTNRRAKLQELEKEIASQILIVKRIKQLSDMIKYENFLSAFAEFKRDAYFPNIDFNSSNSELYKNKLQDIREEQKSIPDELIVVSISTSIQRPKDIMVLAKFVIRSFNIEANLIIENVKYDNLENCSYKISSIFCKYCSLLLKTGLTISEDYLKLKLRELQIVYQYKLKLHQEREEQREERQRQREEERAEKEIKAQLLEAEREEKRLQILERKYNLQLKYAEGAKVEELNNQIIELTERLAKVRENKERALSMAQQTKRGYIYIISNIGSFGENVYKIGMTRRLDPNERIIELGGASVPFPFDTHAIICSDDAPALEAAIHRMLSQYRVNLINNRKEFFRCSLDEIRNVVESLGVTATFTTPANSTDFYLSTNTQTNIFN